MVLAGLPAITEPWNCARPVIVDVVAVGKFHIRRGRRAAVGVPSKPVLVLITELSESMLTTTVAPVGMPENTRSTGPPVGLVRFPVTLKTCFMLVPSPAKVTSKFVRVTVPVAAAVPTQADTVSIWVSASLNAAAALASWMAAPVGAMSVTPVRVPPYLRSPNAMPFESLPPMKRVLPVLMSTLPPTVTKSVPFGGTTREPTPTTAALKEPPPSLSTVKLPMVTILPSASAARPDTR